MAIKLIAPAGTSGIVQGRSGTNYVVASDGTISNVVFSDVDGLMNAGWQVAANRHGIYSTPGAPAAANATVIAAAQTLLAGGATLSISAQPDVPRQLQVLCITGGTVTLSAGSVSLTYAANDGTTQTDVLNFGAALVSGTVTLSTSKGVERLNSWSPGATVTGGSNPTVQIGTNNYIAVPIDPGSVDVAFTKEFKITPTNGTLGLSVPADETVGSLQISTGLITPTTVPDGTHWLGFGYNWIFPG